jgi:predicted RNase H-like nuclease
VEALGVDIPVGLPAPGGRRPADELARKAVGPRWASVFLTPSQDLLEAASYGEARRSGSITAQAYGLARHILAVQPVALADARVHEVHPEVSFAAANGGQPLRFSKMTWNGVNQRRRILSAHGIRIPDSLPPAGQAGVADVLDAAVVAWSAARIAAGQAERIPEGRERIGAIWR